jgi:hypothetical protein
MTLRVLVWLAVLWSASGCTISMVLLEPAGRPDAAESDAGRPDAGKLDGGSDGGTVVAVVVGYGLRRARTTDAITWDSFQQLTPNGGDDYDLLRGVGFGAGTFVAVGNRTFTSTDGITWLERGPTNVSNFLSNVVYFNNSFVAVGANGYRVRSLDLGATWQDATGYQPIHYRDVELGNGMLVAVGHTYDTTPNIGVVVISTDGKSWTEVLHGGDQLRDVAYGNGVFVATGDTGRVVTSPDGLTWSDKAVNGQEVLFANSEFLIRNNTTFYHSADGANWAPLPGAREVNAWFNGYYLSFGWPLAIAASTNLSQWTPVFNPQGSGLCRLAVGTVGP